MHCGHFQSRRHMSTRWDDVNCQVQCVRCNIFSQGEQFKFGQKLDIVYGEGTAKALELKAKKSKKFMRCDIEELIEYYTRKHYTQGKITELSEKDIKDKKYKHWRLFDITKHNF
jgi:hypothetical protein